ncbi:hypothetical protein ACWGEU_04345 [Streptomyces goshikiensis]
MSRIAQVIVLAPYADEVMEPLTRPDDTRSWQGCFEPLGLFVGGWVIEFNRMRARSGLLRHLESLAWPHPESVQVLIHDEEDVCFGLWMMQEGVLTEVQLPGHRRFYTPAPATDEFPPEPGLLWRSETAETAVPGWIFTSRQDQRPAW